MYANAKAILVETTKGIRGEGMKESGKGGAYLILCKDLCKCHNVPSSIKTIKEIR
jgi:hypothetical protein